jgi:hypothetical protein
LEEGNGFPAIEATRRPRTEDDARSLEKGSDNRSPDHRPVISNELVAKAAPLKTAETSIAECVPAIATKQVAERFSSSRLTYTFDFCGPMTLG